MTVLGLSPALARELLTLVGGIRWATASWRVRSTRRGDSFGRCTVQPGVGKTTVCYFNNSERKRMLAGGFADVIPDSRSLHLSPAGHGCRLPSRLRLAKTPSPLTCRQRTFSTSRRGTTPGPSSRRLPLLPRGLLRDGLFVGWDVILLRGGQAMTPMNPYTARHALGPLNRRKRLRRNRLRTPPEAKQFSRGGS